MVWHAFLLNPIDFQTYCRDKKLNIIRHVEFPWAEIVRSPSRLFRDTMTDHAQAQSNRYKDLVL